MLETSVVTIDRHILDQQMQNPGATGAFSRILSDLSLAAKMISREVNMAGLVDIMGDVGSRNVHAEAVQKLDLFAQEVIYKAMDHSGTLCCMVSEESAEIIPIPDRFPVGDYVLMFDPLDGSSNIDVNISIGTIFSLYRKVSDGKHGVLEDCLRAGSEQVASGYVLYGSSTMLVYTAGRGVHGSRWTRRSASSCSAMRTSSFRSPPRNCIRSTRPTRRGGPSSSAGWWIDSRVARKAIGLPDISDPSSRTFIALFSRAASSCIQGTPRRPRANCGCSTRLRPWRFSASRRRQGVQRLPGDPGDQGHGSPPENPAHFGFEGARGSGCRAPHTGLNRPPGPFRGSRPEDGTRGQGETRLSPGPSKTERPAPKSSENSCENPDFA